MERIGVKEVYRGMQEVREENSSLTQQRMFVARYAFARLQRMKELMNSIERQLSALDLIRNVNKKERPWTSPATATRSGGQGRGGRGRGIDGTKTPSDSSIGADVRVVRGPEAAREAAVGLKAITEETVEELVSFTHYVKEMGGELEERANAVERELEGLYVELGMDIFRRKARR